MVSAQARRSQVGYANNRGISVRRACALIGVARSTMGYQPRMAAKDAPVVAVMRELSSQYPRYGYRRIHVFLNRRGHEMSPDRAHRIWRHAQLQVAEETHPAACSGVSAKAGPCDGCEPRMGLRFRLRCLRQRSATEVPHRDR